MSKCSATSGTTKSGSTLSTTGSLRRQAHGFNLTSTFEDDDSEEEQSTVVIGIEDIPWLIPEELCDYLLKTFPKRNQEIMMASPSQLIHIGLDSFQTK